MRLVNLTLHEITIYTDRGILSIPPSGRVARIGGIPINRVEYGEVEGLPEPQPNTYYIVSQPALQALRSAGRKLILSGQGTPRAE
ncbi:MAG: hypothetical protein QXU12_02310 [Nitrososphaerota archaeon]